jgi:beta-galactosidase
MKKQWNTKLLHGADYNYEQWLDMQDILDKDLLYMEMTNSNVMSVGIFSWVMLEKEEGIYNFEWLDNLFNRLHNTGVSVILATPSGSKPTWMSQKYPEICKMTKDGLREHHGNRHNHCRSSRIYKAKCKQINTLLAKRYNDHPALLMWHVSNEYNGSPCYCPECISAFQTWLKNKYGTLEKLNAAWWTTFWSHKFTNWEQIFPDDMSIHGLLLDWQRFTSDQTINFFLEESEPLRRISPEVPITTNFMLPDVGLDYFEFAKHVDVVSWDSYPRWHFNDNEIETAVKTAFFHDMFRSLKDSPFMLMESTPGATNWQGISKTKQPGMHLLSSLQAIAHGSDTVQYFQWRQGRGGEEKFHGAVINHLGTPDTPVFNDVTSVGKALKSINEIRGSGINSQVAIIYDFNNSWALDLAQLPRSIEKCYQEQCIAHYKSLWEQGISVDIIDSVNYRLEKYKLVIIPMLYMFRKGLSQKIKDFVSSGGIVVATYLTGIVDENDLCFLGGNPNNLTDVFGLKIEYTDTITPKEKQGILWKNSEYNITHYADVLRDCTADVLGLYTQGSIKGTPAITRNSFNKGKAYYIAGRVENDFLYDFYKKISIEARIEPIVNWTIPRGVSITQRTSSQEYLFVMNFNNEVVEIDIKNNSYTDLLSSKLLSGKLSIDGYGVLVLKPNKGKTT